MPGQNLIQSVGGGPQKQVRFVPVYTSRWISGLYTNRSLLRGPLDSLYTDFYHMGTTDVLCDGLNSEVSARSTMIRRPGNPPYSSASTTDAIDSFYSFHHSDGTIQVIADSLSDVEVVTPSSITSIFVKNPAAGQGYFQGIDKSLYIVDGVDFVKYIPGTNNPNTNTPIWNFGGVAPGVAPTLAITQIGATGVTWQASTVYSTMGFIIDSNGNVQQLISVNASGLNTTQYGTTGNGQPNWSQTPGGTTNDGSVVWTNWGPVVLWTPATVYDNYKAGPGSLANPVFIYDPTTRSIYGNGSKNFAQGTSGASKPRFTGIPRSFIHDGTIDSWEGFSPIATPWQATHTYAQWQAGFSMANDAIIEPSNLPPGTGQTVFLHVATTGGVSGSSGTQPPWSTVAGTPTVDNDLIWINLGSATWQGGHSYQAWVAGSTSFSTIKDQNGNMQVCVRSGVSGATQPAKPWAANHVYSNGDKIVDQNGNLETVTTGGTSGVAKTISNTALVSTVATFTTSTNHGYAVGQLVTVTGTTNGGSQFNVVDAVITSVPSVTTFTVVILHNDVVSASDSGTSYAGPTWATVNGNTTTDGTVTWTNGGIGTGWGTQYGQQTVDGTATWVCVGTAMNWAANTIWYLPTSGFTVPQPSQAFGGATLTDTNADNEYVINSGKSGTVVPTWQAIGNNTTDGAATWRNVAAFTSVGFAWTKNIGYVYAYKARKNSDVFVTTSPPLQIPGTNSPNITGPLGPPTGSGDGTVTTASPVAQITGANTGAQVLLSGPGSSDPQFDTVEIYRSADGFSSSGPYLFLTDIPMPPIVGGQAGTWQVIDFMDQNATDLLPGLNPLITAPIDHQNDPPPGQFGSTQFVPSAGNATIAAAGTGLIGIVYHQGRMWGFIGNTVFASGGPDTIPGNGFTAWPPAQAFPFQSNITRLLPTTAGLLVFTTTDLAFIGGGPAITDYYSQLIVPGLGLLSWNALTILGGVPYLFSADRQFISIDMSSGVTRIGHPIGNILSGFDPTTAYVTYHSFGDLDHALFVADGSSQWFRCDISPAPDGRYTGPVWSPRATIQGGFKAIASTETSPGNRQLLIGPSAAGKILARDSTFTTFSDNGNPYDSYFVMGNITMAHPGQMAQMNFIDMDFIQIGSLPSVYVLFDEIAPTSQVPFEKISNSFITDPPKLYGPQDVPETLWMNRYYFGQTSPGNSESEPVPAWCKSFQLKVDFGSNTVQNELLAFTMFVALWSEK